MSASKQNCDCGKPGKIGRSQYAACLDCRKNAERIQRFFMTREGRGLQSSCVPGHEQRMALYTERASQELPLFDKG